MATARLFVGEVTELDKQRFWSKVNKSEDNNACWPWAGADGGKGYGKFKWNNRTVNVHRFAWYITYGENPPNETLDHICRNRSCVNVRHLVPETIKNNTLKGTSVTAINKEKSHCPNNHPYFGQNLYRAPDGRRKCRECARVRDQKRYKKRYEEEKSKKTNSSEMRDFARKPKISFELAEEIRKKYSNGNISQRSLAIEYQVSQPLIGMIIRNETWKNN